MTTVASLLTLAGALFIGVIGVLYLAAPARIAPGFGWASAPADANPYYAVKGVRDVGMGVIIVAVLIASAVAQTPAIMGVTLLAGALIPLGDMLVVLRAGGRLSVAFGMHGATAAVVAATGILWLVA